MNGEILEVMLSWFVNSQDHDESTRTKEDFKPQCDLETKKIHISF